MEENRFLSCKSVDTFSFSTVNLKHPLPRLRSGVVRKQKDVLPAGDGGGDHAFAGFVYHFSGDQIGGASVPLALPVMSWPDKDNMVFGLETRSRTDGLVLVRQRAPVVH